jgi:hypothetical protein
MSRNTVESLEARRRVVETAEAILDGSLGMVEGASRLAALRHEVDPHEEDVDFRALAGIDSQTDHLPVGSIRERWDAAALRAKDVELAGHEADFRDAVVRMCRNLVARYAPPS